MNKKRINSIKKESPILIFKIALFFCFLLLFNVTKAQVFYDESSPYGVRSIEGNATWIGNSGDFVYDNNGTNSQNRALLYSTEAYQSKDGFRLTVEYTTGSVEDDESHNFSFGLISEDTDLATYTGLNPFRADQSVYSVGVNFTTDEDPTARGINFTNGTQRITLGNYGARKQFVTGTTTKITMEIGVGGFWTYRINDEYADSGVLVNEIDLSKKYHLVIYGQDDNGDGKSIQSIKLEKAPALGERADKLRGTWNIACKVDDHYNGRSEVISIAPFMEQIKDLKTLNSVALWLSSSTTKSATFTAPHKLLESFWQGDLDVDGKPKNLVVPRWGDGIEPATDPFGNWCRDVKAAGLNVKVYVNSENIIGKVLDAFTDVDDRWKNWCDTDPEAQKFMNSQPYHTGIWNASTQQYEDASATYPDRKYLFCYAEYILKDYSLRYGHYISSWIFDSAEDINKQGDNFSSGLIEEQRIYQAFANAVRTGNPEIPVAFQNGRSTINYEGYPYSIPTHFDDFTFGHAFGGNNDHAEKVTGPQFNLNYRYVTRMTATNGHVYDAGNWDWDNLVVGNFHSKLSTTSWSGGNVQAWEEPDFLQWNKEAVTAGGSMTWGIPHIQNSALSNNFNLRMQGWSLDLLLALDKHLAENLFSGAPQWTKQHTILPPAYIGKPYSHKLVTGADFWDPEGDAITSLNVVAGSVLPTWVTIEETAIGEWTLSGIPTETVAINYEFNMQVSDASGGNDRLVELSVIENAAPKWIGYKTFLPVAHIGEPYSYDLVEGVNFSDPEGDEITSVAKVIEDISPSWLTITQTTSGVWTLSGTPTETTPTDYEFGLQVKDAAKGTNRTVTLNVLEYVAPTTMDVEIKAAANTNYGLNTIATMFSEVQTAPDGLATFRVSIDVKPTTDKAIMSGVSGGPATTQSWGVGNGAEPSESSDYVFGGSNNEWVENINNIQIVDFNANGGLLNAGTISSFFKSITIINAQSGKDFVSLKVGAVNASPGKLANATQTIDLEFATTVSDIADFAVGVGNAESTNKWSVEGISVKVDFNGKILSTLEPTLGEVTTFKLFPNPAQHEITINLPIHSASIIDVSGRIVKKYSERTVNFDISDLASGVYILKGISDQDVMLVKRFVKSSK